MNKSKLYIQFHMRYCKTQAIKQETPKEVQAGAITLLLYERNQLIKSAGEPLRCLKVCPRQGMHVLGLFLLLVGCGHLMR